MATRRDGAVLSVLKRSATWTTMRPVNRPERQRTHLLLKIASKESISLKKPGKRTKRWKKWADKYKPTEPAK